MIISIEICDVCKRINRSGLPVVTLVLGGDSWDVGHCCKQQPFRRVQNTSVTKNHLLALIEALIVAELPLLKEPV